MKCIVTKLDIDINNNNLEVFDEIEIVNALAPTQSGQYVNLDGLMEPYPKLGEITIQVDFIKRTLSGVSNIGSLFGIRNTYLFANFNGSGDVAFQGQTTHISCADGEHTIYTSNAEGKTLYDGQEYTFAQKAPTSDSYSVLNLFGNGGNNTSEPNSYQNRIAAVKRLVVMHNGITHEILPARINGKLGFVDTLTGKVYYPNTGDLEIVM